MNLRWIAPVLALGLPFGVQAEGEPPQETKNILIQGDELTLDDLLETAQGLLGIDCFLVSPPDLLEESVAFRGTAELAPGDFLPFFESLLRTYGLLHLERPAGMTTVHSIHSITAQGGRGTSVFKTLARVVTPAQARAMASRSTLITTTYTCKCLSARDAVNTLQPYFADSFTDNVRNIEGTPHILMTGYSSTIAGLLELLDLVDVTPAEGTAAWTQHVTMRELSRTVEDLTHRIEELESGR